MTPKKTLMEKSVLMVPLFLAFIWMGFLVVNVQAPEANMRLAPARLDSLVNALFAFIIIYAVVLVVVFFKMNKKTKETIPKSSPKKKAKKKK